MATRGVANIPAVEIEVVRAVGEGCAGVEVGRVGGWVGAVVGFGDGFVEVEVGVAKGVGEVDCEEVVGCPGSQELVD